MKRVLSWIVAALVAWVARAVFYLIFALAFFLLEKAHSFSEVLFWVLVVLEGSAAIGFLMLIVLSGASLVVIASQKVRKSLKGTRYVVIGSINAIFYALSLVGLIKGLVVMDTAGIFTAIACVVFGIYVAIAGKQQVAIDGAPESKVEELEAKLAKAKEKEAKNGHNS
jgi:hypothetical protein